MSGPILPFSAQNAIFDAISRLEQNDDSGALEILDRALPALFNSGKISNQQLGEIYKILFEEMDLSTSDYVLQQQKVILGHDPKDINHIKAQALDNLAKDSVSNLLKEVLKTTDYNSAYSISIPLLGASYLKDEESYLPLKNKMFGVLGLNPNDTAMAMIKKLEGADSFKIWLLGRILQATMNMGDKGFAKRIASVMETLLEKQGNDACAVWAKAYLSLYDSTKRKGLIASTQALASVPEEAGKDNVPWAIVMNLQSLSFDKKHEGLYKQQLEELKEFTKTATVVEALRTIPSGDFRAWAMSLVLLAAKRMGDDKTYAEVLGVITKEIEESPSKGDQMLAAEITNLAKMAGLPKQPL